MDSVSHKHKDGSSHTYPCPPAIAEYNRKMGGVDYNNQLRGYYHVRLKCRKYYKYIFWFMFDLIVTNCFILCRDFTDLPYKSVKEFRVALAKELIGSYGSRKRPGCPRHTPAARRFCQAHFPTRGAENGRRCHHCYHKKQRHQTVWYCKDCNIFYVIMGVTTIVSASTTSNMDHLVWTKIISVAKNFIHLSLTFSPSLSLSLTPSPLHLLLPSVLLLCMHVL